MWNWVQSLHISLSKISEITFCHFSFWISACYRVDSVTLVEEGFDVVSVDASDKMLKYALRERWNRRKEPGFDRWSKWFSNRFTSTQITFIRIFVQLLMKRIG